ncbi:polysaccharide pyruvyl transferase family protein [Solimonas sp. C16B3]|uniref:Polysaccharide pyruvyl transferase family protein n=1 Tax=Solimonas marina TaxID=2714601 RepID=A0A969W9Z2_9GAMM|nr:polysaccharide pyruvyl transferase family protein [Solimonas marina]NKF21646.1 polysaccharide pyruvyl transferase family protein [Solimonas marina]
MKIVFSATRQWNPGDEFILRGCIRAFALAGVDVMPVLFNRHPQIRPAHRRRARWGLGALKSLRARARPFFDNSVKDATDIGFADAVVFAGSPQWRGARVRTLYEKIAAHDVPTCFLGLGTNRHFRFDRRHFSKLELDVLQRSRLITCRDPLTTECLQPLPVRHLPCPAFLSAERVQRRTTIRRVALIFGSDQAVTSNNISPATFAYLCELYARLIAAHGTSIEFELVAHYIDELPHFFARRFAICRCAIRTTRVITPTSIHATTSSSGIACTASASPPRRAYPEFVSCTTCAGKRRVASGRSCCRPARRSTRRCASSMQ